MYRRTVKNKSKSDPKTTNDELKSILENNIHNLIAKNVNFLSESDTDTSRKGSNKNLMDPNELAVKDKVLSTNCLELKKVIMDKTRKLFDKSNDFYHRTDRILKNNTQIINNPPLSPRKTRSRASFKNLLTSSDESMNLSNIGVPISCSTFANCELHESCNLPSTSSSTPAATNRTQATAVPTKTNKPSIRNIESCNYLLNRQNSNEANTIIGQQTMELTPVQDVNRFSMDVNTSLDNIYSKSPEAKPADTDKINFKHGRVKMAAIDEENENGLITENNYCQNLRNLLTNDGDCDVVEGTPELTQKSRLLIQRNTSLLATPKNNFLDNHRDKENDRLESTIILDDLILNKDPKISDKGTVIIDETSEESGDDSDADRNKYIMETVKKKLSIGKRRLFTQQSSPVALSSLSPMSSGLSPMISPKRKKWVRRRKVRRSLTVTQTICTRSQTSINNSSSLNLKQAPVSSFTQPNLRVGQNSQIVKGDNGKKDKEKEKNMKDDKKEKKRRVIKSKKIVTNKKNKRNLLSLVSQKTSHESAGEDSSRSSNVFMENKRLVKKSRIHSKSIIIVATGLCNGDKDTVREAVKKLGGAKMESTVTKKTTHVVTTGVRTINLLRGIIRGCWLITFEWIKKSIEASTWLPPDKFEVQHFSRVLKENRRDREIFGNSYVPELFTACGLIHIQNNTTPPRDILKELIKTAGGQTIDDPKKAKITIGPTGIKELWVLDSITTGELQPTDQYKR